MAKRPVMYFYKNIRRAGIELYTAGMELYSFINYTALQFHSSAIALQIHSSARTRWESGFSIEKPSN